MSRSLWPKGKMRSKSRTRRCAFVHRKPPPLMRGPMPAQERWLKVARPAARAARAGVFAKARVGLARVEAGPAAGARALGHEVLEGLAARAVAEAEERALNASYCARSTCCPQKPMGPPQIRPSPRRSRSKWGSVMGFQLKFSRGWTKARKSLRASLRRIPGRLPPGRHGIPSVAGCAVSRYAGHY
jgi:hypothetical protein